jgi:hypothetical protein
VPPLGCDKFEKLPLSKTLLKGVIFICCAEDMVELEVVF